MSVIKKYEELTFADDFMFCKVMEHNPDLCKEVIELILGKRIEIIKSIDRQKEIEITPDGKGIRLDVRVEGDATVYDLEMQNAHKEDLPRRSRYYQSLIDLDMMERGAKYRDLKDSVIIFICRFDPFGAQRGSYTVKKMIEEAPDYQYNDGTRLLFLSTLPIADGSMNDDLRCFLDYVDGKVAASELTDRIEAAVKKARRQENWRKEYMLFYEYLDDAKAEGREEGREETLAELVRDGILELSEAAKRAGLSEEEFCSKTGLNLPEE